MRKRVIKKYGDTWIIKLEPADVKDFELSVGDEVNIEDLVLLNKEDEDVEI